MNAIENPNLVVDTISLDAIQEFAARAFSETRIVDNIKVGQFVRQGDLYITRIEKVNKTGHKVTAERQLAPGTNQGSRHTVNGDVTVYARAGDNLNVDRNTRGFTVMGPQLSSETSFRVEHPQHAHFLLPPGDYQVSYQVDPNQMARVMD